MKFEWVFLGWGLWFRPSRPPETLRTICNLTELRRELGQRTSLLGGGQQQMMDGGGREQGRQAEGAGSCPCQEWGRTKDAWP